MSAVILTALHLPAILWACLSFLHDGWRPRAALAAARKLVTRRVAAGEPAMGRARSPKRKAGGK